MFTNLFNCNKKDSDLFNYFQNATNTKSTSLDENVFIGNYEYKTNNVMLEIECIFRSVRKKWFQLQNMILNDSTISCNDMTTSRDLINKSFQAIIKCLQACSECERLQNLYQKEIGEQINSKLSTAILPLANLENDIMVKLSRAAMNNVKCPVYQFVHTFLDVRCYLLIIDYICGKRSLQIQLESLMKDLVVLSKENYIRQTGENRTIFQCSCVKNSWLLTQFFSEKIAEDSFWTIFNSLLLNEDNGYFVLCLMRNVAQLQTFNRDLVDEGNKCERIKPNFVLLEAKVKAILLDVDTQNLGQCFKLIQPLVCNLWLKNAKIEVYQTIWEYFSKRLNVSNNNHKSPNAVEVVQIINVIILNSSENDMEDFEFFVGMLMCHLREFPAHWGKMKGRIFSQLGANKVRDLSDVGIVHVMVLFTVLASIYNEELTKKVLGFLDNLPSEKRMTSSVWNVTTAFIIRQVAEDRSLELVAPTIRQMLQEASSDQKNFRLIKEFISNWPQITSSNLQLHQWLLINTWLTKYLSSCYHLDMTETLKVLLTTLEKVSSPDTWPNWKDSYKEHVYSSLKLLSHSGNPPAIIGRLAGKISSLDSSLGLEAFTFYNSESMAPAISSEFLQVVLDNYPGGCVLTQIQETLVVQSWAKICLLTVETQVALTSNVLKLDLFPAALKQHLASAKDPFHALLEYLGTDVKQHVKLNWVNKLCEAVFGHADRFVAQYLAQQPQNQAIVVRAYTCLALAFLHCGVLLYRRHQTTCTLTRLINTLLLPSEFLIGAVTPHAFVLASIKKTWHLFFEAIVDLNQFGDDLFLERSLRDLIVKYMAFFSTVDSPIVKCLDNDRLAVVILDKMSITYFKHPSKESDSNVLKALRILKDYIESPCCTSIRLRLVVNKVLYGLLEMMIFHAQKNQTISVINSIISSRLYPQIKEDFRVVLQTLTEKHLAFNTISYFQLMNVLAKFIKADLKSWMDVVKRQVVNVERMRGVGFDQGLRLHLEKLQETLV